MDFAAPTSCNEGKRDVAGHGDDCGVCLREGMTSSPEIRGREPMRKDPCCSDRGGILPVGTPINRLACDRETRRFRHSPSCSAPARLGQEGSQGSATEPTAFPASSSQCLRESPPQSPAPPRGHTRAQASRIPIPAGTGRGSGSPQAGRVRIAARRGRISAADSVLKSRGRAPGRPALDRKDRTPPLHADRARSPAGPKYLTRCDEGKLWESIRDRDEGPEATRRPHPVAHGRCSPKAGERSRRRGNVKAPVDLLSDDYPSGTGDRHDRLCHARRPRRRFFD